MAELFDNSMNMMLTSQYRLIEATQQTICIAVCDESSPPVVTDAKWIEFRTNWPQRPYYLLKPFSTQSMNIPTPTMANELNNDGLSFGPIPVNRENNVNAAPDVGVGVSDWYSICNVSAHYNSPSFISDRILFLFVDDSGSLTVNHVTQSITNLINNCANDPGGPIEIFAVSNEFEEYVDPFISFSGKKIEDYCDMPVANYRGPGALPPGCSV